MDRKLFVISLSLVLLLGASSVRAEIGDDFPPKINDFSQITFTGIGMYDSSEDGSTTYSAHYTYVSHASNLMGIGSTALRIYSNGIESGLGMGYMVEYEGNASHANFGFPVHANLNNLKDVFWSTILKINAGVTNV